jgi:hypothetical protein
MNIATGAHLRCTYDYLLLLARRDFIQPFEFRLDAITGQPPRRFQPRRDEGVRGDNRLANPLSFLRTRRKLFSSVPIGTVNNL